MSAEIEARALIPLLLHPFFFFCVRFSLSLLLFDFTIPVRKQTTTTTTIQCFLPSTQMAAYPRVVESFFCGNSAKTWNTHTRGSGQRR
jgi:hypothetical protein